MQFGSGYDIIIIETKYIDRTVGKRFYMKWYVTNGIDVKAFNTHYESQMWCKEHTEYYEIMD